ncbi:MAG: FAD-binding protein [Deltaproteobacteria bacterium]|nr:FAD-binding protein [Deltaproteobacteria bacterium]
MHSYDILTADVLVIGGGAAACMAAISAKEDGADVLVLDKGQLGKSGCSPNAHGGMAVFHKEPQDSWRVHMEDTLMSGGFLNDQRLVQLLCQQGEQFGETLERFGSLFNRDEDGSFSVRQFGGHRYKRSIFCGDETGHEMMNGLKREIHRLNIRFKDETMVIRLLIDEGVVVGAVAWDMTEGKFYQVIARAVILATADGSGIWPSASERQRGDGLYLALEAGAEVMDVEFIQYHPTHAWWPYGVRGSVSESFRAEGGILLNSEGERFMERYDPEKKELATRDKVSVCIFKEIQAGRGAPHGGIYASVTHLDPEHVVKRLPVIFRKYMSYGFDIRKQPIEVRYRPHYLCGGVIIDVHSKTKVPGLYAAGAVTAGVHGANRLGSNALVDILVFGKIAGESAAKEAREKSPRIGGLNGQVEEEIEKVKNILSPKRRPVPVAPLRRKHCEMMDQYMGVVRTESGMKTMLEEIHRAMDEDLSNISVPDASLLYNYGLRDALEMTYRLVIEEMSTRAALERKESRGSHFREDFPERNDTEWLKNIVFFKKNGELKMEKRQVNQPIIPIQDLPEYANNSSPWH